MALDQRRKAKEFFSEEMPPITDETGTDFAAARIRTNRKVTVKEPWRAYTELILLDGGHRYARFREEGRF